MTSYARGATVQSAALGKPIIQAMTTNRYVPPNSKRAYDEAFDQLQPTRTWIDAVHDHVHADQERRRGRQKGANYRPRIPQYNEPTAYSRDVIIRSRMVIMGDVSAMSEYMR